MVTVLLASCSSIVPDLELSSNQTGVYLTMRSPDSSPGATKSATPIFQNSVDTGQALLATRGSDVRIVLNGSYQSYLKQGFVLENEQEIMGFGQTLSEQYASFLQYDKLWSISQGEGITVAVIDSGVTAIATAFSERVLPGYDFVNNQPGGIDESGHGTAVASLIAGEGRIKGVAPAAQILPLKVLDRHDQGSSLSLIRALYYAANLLPDLENPYKVDLVNISLGMGDYSPGVHEAIKKLNELGIAVVAAAGNSPGELAFPASLDEVLAVGAADLRDDGWTLSAYSGFGNGLDVLVPMSIALQDERGFKHIELEALGHSADAALVTGTSFAAPQVTGVLALLLAKGQNAETAVKTIKLASSDLFSPGYDAQSGYGLFDPWASMRAVTFTDIGFKGDFAVQVLDAESLQELRFTRAGLETFIALDAGQYLLKVWTDKNQDGLWNEASEGLAESLYSRVTDVELGKTTFINVSF